MTTPLLSPDASDALRWRDEVTKGAAEMRQMYEIESADQTEGILWPACLILLRHLEKVDWCAVAGRISHPSDATRSAPIVHMSASAGVASGCSSLVQALVTSLWLSHGWAHR